jgi:hypothetical protein
VTTADLDIVRSNYRSFLLPTGRLAGDANNDGVVNDLDLFAVWQDLSKPPNARNLAHDLDGDGLITPADLDIVRANYAPLTAIPTSAAQPALTTTAVSLTVSLPSAGMPMATALPPPQTSSAPQVQSASIGAALALLSPADGDLNGASLASGMLDLEWDAYPFSRHHLRYFWPHWWKAKPRPHGFI